MAGIHGLQHIQGFAASDFTYDNAVRAHTEGVLYQVPDGDCPFPFDVGRAGFQCHHMGLLQTKFRCIFDGDDTFIMGNKGRQHVQTGGFTGAGTTADHDIQLRLHAGAEENSHLLRQGAEGNEIFHGKWRFGKLSDRHAGSDEGQRRNDDIDTGTVRQAGIHQRRCFIYMTADGGDDFVDNGH